MEDLEHSNSTSFNQFSSLHTRTRGSTDEDSMHATVTSKLVCSNFLLNINVYMQRQNLLS